MNRDADIRSIGYWDLAKGILSVASN